ncbi:tetratricopeptide repeat protein [Croceicoccus bisphenolivorans]|uniref:tetratricopeptide repeat protein n=1 Tax=Croceicoccus bisphenolivorans TaxID=1783232 RepID=UPI000A7265F6|nr:hypothetical protein [Croceicoccus bisphenolivorans]
MRKIATIAGLVLAATSLGGCQSIFGSGTASADLNDIDMTDYFQQRLTMGKLHLQGGRPTRAIVAFRQASYDPRFAGEAFNGMAIAYDRIGRADLAARYFAQAVEAAPGDERFARNLARLEGRGPIPLPALPETAPVEMAVTDLALPDVRGAVTIYEAPEDLRGPVKVEKAPAVTVARVAQGQVSVGVKQNGSVTRMAGQSVEPARITVETRGSGISASDRVAQRARRNAQARKAYPIRIVLRSDKASVRP